MKGWKTVIFGALLAVVPALTDYLGAVDWKAIGLAPSTAALLGAAVIALRAATTTPLGKSAPLPPKG